MSWWSGGWWSIDPRKKGGKERRAAAKQKYEEDHPLVEHIRTGRRTGYYVSANGRHQHFYGGRPDQAIAEMAAQADCEPIPASLAVVGLVWVGRRGMYAIDLSSPERFRRALAKALDGESLAAKTAG